MTTRIQGGGGDTRVGGVVASVVVEAAVRVGAAVAVTKIGGRGDDGVREIQNEVDVEKETPHENPLHVVDGDIVRNMMRPHLAETIKMEEGGVVRITTKGGVSHIDP